MLFAVAKTITDSSGYRVSISVDIISANSADEALLVASQEYIREGSEVDMEVKEVRAGRLFFFDV